MCWEHSNVNFGHQGVPSASQCDSGTTYTGVKYRVSRMSVQSFKAVASIVWVGGQKYQLSLAWVITMHA